MGYCRNFSESAVFLIKTLILNPKKMGDPHIMSSTHLATVIVPCCNSPDLFAALSSILEQDYPRIQLIIVDDASISFSEEEVEAFLCQNSHSNLESYLILVNSENQGTVRSLNLALRRSHGDYIFTLAGDDCFYDSHVLSDWVSAFLETGAQVMTAYRAIYDDLLHTSSGVQPTPEQVRKIQTMTPAALFEDLAEVNYIFGCCTARTADSLRQYGLFDDGYRLIEDHPMNLRLLRQGIPIVFFDRIVVKYRKGGASSPMRYNAIYAQDVNRILTNDVLPYTTHPHRMRVKYAMWKWDQRLLQRRARLLAQHSDSKAIVLLINGWYGLHHPCRALRKLRGLIQKTQEKGEE